MPYTLSHVIIALPISVISKRKVPVVAVAVGSISPDFPYMVALSPTHAPGHSMLGVLLYCLIPSLLFLFGWYRWLEKYTLEFWKLPARSDSSEMPSIGLIIVGVLLGAYSHVLWDATSHSYGFIAENSQFLNDTYFTKPLYKWNQYGSGVLGLIALGFWYVLAWFENINSQYNGKFYLGLIVYGTSIFCLVILANTVHQSTDLSDFVVRTSIGLMSGGFVGAIVYSALICLQNKLYNCD